MSDAATDGDHLPPSEWNRLILRLLPVGQTTQLLADLALAWLTVTRATAVLVFLPPDEADKSRGSFATVAAPPTPVELRRTEDRAPRLDEVFKELSRILNGGNLPQLPSDARQEQFPFEHDERSFGGVILFQTQQGAYDPGEATFLAELSARLISQALDRERTAGERRVLLSPDEAKLEALAEFAAGAGHEINNPLAAISGRAQLLLRGETDPQRRQALHTIGGQVDRIRDMIGDVMLFARPPEPVCEALLLGEVVAATVDRMNGPEFDANRRITLDDGPDVPIWADRTQLHVVINSLLANSLDAAGPGGRVSITTEPLAAEEPPLALLSITDNGPGLTAADCEHLFDPFYSGRQAGRGLGFGLSKCWRIVSNHRGRIEVDSVPGVETTFRVFWPSGPPGNAAAAD